MKNKKVGTVATVTSSKPKTFINAGAVNMAFDVSDFAENSEKMQAKCALWNPPLQTKSGRVKLCVNCAASGQKLAAQLFAALNQPRKVICLQRCFACNGNFAPSKFSTFFGICQRCFAERDQSKLARGNFAERVARNVRRVLGGVR